MMKNWLALVCVLGSLCGGVFTKYSTVSVGSEGLKSMATSLTSISKVMNTYFKNLNNARDKVMPSIINLQTYVNTTYAALNASYGATHQPMRDMMWSVEWFSQQFYYGEQQVSSYIGYDLYELNHRLQQTIDNIMENYNYLVSSFSYDETADYCKEQSAAMYSSLPSQLIKFGQCLQAEVEIVPILVAPLKDIFSMVLSDLKSFNKQLDICAALSTNCINEYFTDIYGELHNINMDLYLADSLLRDFQHDYMQINQLCGELIRDNVEDAIQNLQMQFGHCVLTLNSME